MSSGKSRKRNVHMRKKKLDSEEKAEIFQEDKGRDFKFKITFLYNNNIFTEVYIAKTLQDLSEQILKSNPAADIVSIIGG